MGERFWLKIGRCDIQVGESNGRGVSHLSKSYCSSVVAERSPKKPLLHPPFYYHQRESIAFHTLSLQREVNYFNMAYQVDQIKKHISNLMEILMNSEVVFHEILLL